MQTIHFKIILSWYYPQTFSVIILWPTCHFTLFFFSNHTIVWAWFSQSGWRKCKKKWNLTQKLPWKFYTTTPALQHSYNLMILKVLHPKLFSPNWTLVNALLKKIGKKPPYAGKEKRKRVEVKMWKVTVKGALQLFEPKIYLIILLSGLAWSLELSRTEGQEVLGI